MSKLKKSIVFLTRLLLFLVIFIPVFFYVILTVEPIQNYVNYKLTSYLQENLNTDIQISSVSYQPPFDFVVKEVLVANVNDDDTLFFVQRASVRPVFYSVRKKNLLIDKVSVNGALIKYNVDSSGYSNLDYFLVNLPESEDTVSSESNFSLKIKNIETRNASVFYSNKIKDTLPYGFDFDTLNFHAIDFRINDFQYFDNNISLRIAKFKAKEQSGFEVKNVSANFLMNDTLVDFEHLNIGLNKTNILFDNIYIVLDTFDYQKSYFNIELNELSNIDLTDLGYFSDIFKDYNQSFNIGLNVEGEENDLNINNLYVQYGDNTLMNMNGIVLGLPDIENTYFDLNINHFRTSGSDLGKITDPLTKESFVKLPDSISLPEKIDIDLNLSGSAKDATIDGNILSTDGNVYLNIRYFELNENTHLNGNIKLRDINLEKILKDTLYGYAQLDDSISLRLGKNNKIFAENYTKILNFDYNDYSYKNIHLNARVNNDDIKAEVFSYDKNLKLKGEFEFKNYDEKDLLFRVDLDTANLNPLNFTEDDPLSFLSIAIQGNLHWKELEDMTGSIGFYSPLVLIMNLQKTEIKSLKVNLKNMYYFDEGVYKYISIKSDFMQGHIQGIIDPIALSEKLINIPQYYFSVFIEDSLKNIFNDSADVVNNFELNLEFQNLSVITKIISPTLNIADNTNLKVIVKNQEHMYNMSFTSDSIRYGTQLIRSLVFHASAEEDKLLLDLNVDSIGLDKINFQKLNLTSFTINDSLNTEISWNNISEKNNQGKINLKMAFEEDSLTSFPSIIIFLNKDSIFVNDYKWILSAGKFLIKEDKVIIPNFTVKSKYGGSLSILGNLGVDTSDVINVLIDRFDISQLNELLPEIEIKGYLSSLVKGVALMSDKRQLFMKNSISRFSINDVELGIISQDARIINDSLLQMNISLDRTGTTTKIINGVNTPVDTLYNAFNLLAQYNLNSQGYFADLVITNFKFSPFRRYFEDYLTFFGTSNINGHIFISGVSDLFDIKGDLNVFGGFVVKQTGVRYSLNNGLHMKFNTDNIILEKSVITGPDLAGDLTVWGSVKHNHFKDIYVDFFVDADTIEVLNKERTKEDDYFGKVIISTDAEIFGYLENLTLKADVVAENKTNLTVLLNQPGEVSNKTTILNFVNQADTTVIEKEIAEKMPMNINVDVNLRLNPDAKFKLLMDELSGEGFEMQGSGNVKIKKTSLGDLILVGKIEIEKGIYNFVLQNIINKKFKIQKGSYIVFNGEPTDGLIDITTVYTVKNVNLYNLLQDDTYSETKTQADCYIYLKGIITEPKISFSVDLPKADRKIAAQLSSLDEANMNKQFLSLLLIGRFQPLPGLVFDPNANLDVGNFNPGELISNQLNNLLSNLGTDVNVDLNYQTGDATTSDQYDVAVSVPLLNERVSINTDVGVGGTNQDVPGNNFIGDFEVDVKLNKEGNLILKGYNKTNRNDFYEEGYTQGIGIQYKTSLDKIFYPDSLHNQIKKKKEK